MPRMEDINRFNVILKTLGSEPQILQERSEPLEDVPVPESELPSDLSELLDSTPGDASLPDTAELPEEESGGISSEDLAKSLDLGDIEDVSVSEDMLDLIGTSADEEESTPPSDLDTTRPGDQPADVEIPEDMTGGGEEELEGFELPEEPGAEEPPPGDQPLGIGIPEDMTGGGEEGLEGFEFPEVPGTDKQPPGDQPLDLGIPDDMIGEGEEKEPPDQSILSEEELGEFGLPEDLGAGEQPPGDQPLDLGIPEDFIGEGEEGQPPDEALISEEGLGDFGTPEKSGEETEFPGDIGDITFPEDLGEEGLGELPIPEDLTGETHIPEGEPEELSLPKTFEEEYVPDKEVSEEMPFTESISEEVSPGGETDSGIEAFEVGDEEEFFIDEFSLPEMDEEYEAERNEELAGDEGIGGEKAKAFDQKLDQEILITDEEFASIQKTLETLPINLKIEVENLIAKAEVEGRKLGDLVNLLIKEAPVSEIAALVTEITGKRIKLPKRFEKKAGVSFEEERKSFAYVLRENIVPLLGVLIPALIVLVFLGIGLFNLYVWFDVQNQFKQGIMYIGDDDFSLGNEMFKQAYAKWPDNHWYITYAEAFIKKNQYHYAQEKYEELLNMKWAGNDIDHMGNRDKNGIISYAAFETKIRGNYKKAATLLDYLIFFDPYNKKGLLASGDNFLEWAQEDETYFENASNAYAIYQSKYNDDAVKFRYLRFFMVKDDVKRVMELKNYFQSKKNVKVEPDIYAQLGGYLIDNNEYADVRDILDRARKADPSVPEIHYHLARYLRVMNEPGEEKKALIEAKRLYREVPPLSFTENKLRRYIDTYNRLGELYAAEGRTGLAEIEFDDAISIIEDKQSRKILGKHPDLGLVYYNRGSLFYDAKLFNATLAYFKKAEENLYKKPEMNYKTGYVHYRNEDYLDALIEFYKAERGLRSNVNVIFAIGNSLYFRGDYFAAQGYYNHLLDILEKKRDAIEILRPFEEPEHKSLINFTMRTYNNLGVTLIKLSKVSKNTRKESEGIVYLTKSAEDYDILDRLIENPQTMERDMVTKNLAYLNQRHVFYPQTNYELLIYNTIPLNSKTLDIDNLFSTKIEY